MHEVLYSTLPISSHYNDVCALGIHQYRRVVLSGNNSCFTHLFFYLCRGAKYGEFQVANTLLQNLYGNFTHFNIFNNQKYTYRLTLTAEEQWKFVNTTGQLTVLIPHKNQVPTHEKGLAHYKYLDLLNMVSIYFHLTVDTPVPPK